MSDASVRSPLFLPVIGVVAVIVIASALYWFTQNADEQHMRPGDSHVTLIFQGYARSYDLHVPPQYDGKRPPPLGAANFCDGDFRSR